MENTSFWQCHSLQINVHMHRCPHNQSNSVFFYTQKLKNQADPHSAKLDATMINNATSFVEDKVRRIIEISVCRVFLSIVYFHTIYTLRMAFDYYCCIFYSTFVRTELSHEIIAVFVTPLCACICLCFIYNLQQVEKGGDSKFNWRFRHFRASMWLYLFYIISCNLWLCQ